MSTEPGVLDGYKVVELGVWIAGPAAAGLLADWGAEVIKVESAVGDPQRHVLASLGRGADRLPPFEVDNRGKRSVVIDLKSDAGRQNMDRLLDDADVFITNLRVDALRKLGLDPDAVRSRFPSLVYGLVTGYGSSGPDADRAAYDVAGFWARTGVANSFTVAGGEPPILPPSYGDHLTATSLVAGIGAALAARERTGNGRLVETSLLRTGMYAVAADLSGQVATGRSGRTLARNEAPQPLVNAYRCGDGLWLWLILLESDRHWPTLTGALDSTVEGCDLGSDERFATARGRMENRRELIAAFDEHFATKTRDEWAAVFEEHDVWWAPQATPAEVIADPQVIAANGIIAMPGSDTLEPLDSIAGPVDFDGQATQVRRASPQVGEHTDEVAAEFGFETP